MGSRVPVRQSFVVLCLALAAAITAVPEPGRAAAEEGIVTSASTTLSGSRPLSSLERRIQDERETEEKQFVITSHRPNYILPLTYNWHVNTAPYGPEGERFSPVEIKFQISFKMPIAENVFGDNGNVYLAYTQLSFWQAYNHDISSPFRETNYEPEAFLMFDTDVSVLGLRNRLAGVGLVHQSNGRTETLSRSWNRIYAQFILDHRNFVLSVKPWYRFNESAETDDNPDINRYMGPGEVRLLYEWKKYVAALLLRCNFRPDNLYGAVEVEGSFPIGQKLKGYVQYFYGYGESLIDYNARTSRFGIGILLSDWL